MQINTRVYCGNQQAIACGVGFPKRAAFAIRAVSGQMLSVLHRVMEVFIFGYEQAGI